MGSLDPGMEACLLGKEEKHVRCHVSAGRNTVSLLPKGRVEARLYGFR